MVRFAVDWVLRAFAGSHVWRRRQRVAEVCQFAISLVLNIGGVGRGRSCESCDVGVFKTTLCGVSTNEDERVKTRQHHKQQDAMQNKPSRKQRPQKNIRCHDSFQQATSKQIQNKSEPDK